MITSFTCAECAIWLCVCVCFLVCVCGRGVCQYNILYVAWSVRFVFCTVLWFSVGFAFL